MKEKERLKFEEEQRKIAQYAADKEKRKAKREAHMRYKHELKQKSIQKMIDKAVDHLESLKTDEVSLLLRLHCRRSPAYAVKSTMHSFEKLIPYCCRGLAVYRRTSALNVMSSSPMLLSPSVSKTKLTAGGQKWRPATAVANISWSASVC